MEDTTQKNVYGNEIPVLRQNGAEFSITNRLCFESYRDFYKEEAAFCHAQYKILLTEVEPYWVKRIAAVEELLVKLDAYSAFINETAEQNNVPGATKAWCPPGLQEAEEDGEITVPRQALQPPGGS